MNQIEAFRRWHSDFLATLAAMTQDAGSGHVADMSVINQSRTIVSAASAAAIRCAGTVAVTSEEQAQRITAGVLEALLAPSSLSHIRAGSPEVARTFTAGANSVARTLTQAQRIRVRRPAVRPPATKS